MVSEYPNRLIFLDFDGCVTSQADGTYFNPDPSMYHPSKDIVDRLVKFCLDNDVKIMISSNWRKFDIDGVWKNKYGSYKNPLAELKKMIKSVYYDTLPPTRHVSKSDALIQWLDNNPDFSGQFVIFDDDLREDFQDTVEYDIKKRFIHVDSENGITDADLGIAARILKV